MVVLDRVDALDDETVRDAIRRLKPGERLFLDTPITVDEFYELIDEDCDAELILGVITMPTPPSDPHEDLVGWLLVVLRAYLKRKQLGIVRGSRTAMRISSTSAREPDLLFVSNAHRSWVKRLELDGPADFIIEVVDSAKARHEAVMKQAQYEELGVPELWIVDLPRKELRQLVWSRGRYQHMAVDVQGEVESRQVPGFHLKVAWLFQGPDMPDILEVVHGLLASPGPAAPQR